MNLNILHNKIILINIAIVTTALIVIIMLNVPTRIDYEELATIPYDYTPNPTVNEWIHKQVTVEVKQPELFSIDYATYTVTVPVLNHTVTSTTEYQPYPMNPAVSILVCDSINPDDTVLVLAIKKMDTTSAVYAIIIDNTVRCYFSDPFPTGYNSIVIYVKIESKIDNIKVEIRKVRELG